MRSARRTTRLDQIAHRLALSLGERPAASFARRLSIPVDNNTLRKRRRPSFAPPTIIGVDNSRTAFQIDRQGWGLLR
jgi:hypothetical protein